jgi:N-acetylneuraminic acid mutarotase
LASAAAGRVYAIGGFSTDFAKTHDSVEAYDPGADSWRLVAPMLTPRGNPAAAAIDKRVYAIGGFAPKVGTDRVEVFDPSANRWARVARLPVALTGLGAVAFKGRIFTAGGGTKDGAVRAVHIYNPKTDRWSSDAAPMPTARELLKLTQLDGRLYAIGGVSEAGQFLATVERYDPQADSWETVAPMGTPRGNPGVATAGGRIFVVGGAGGQLGPGTVVALTSSEVFDPQTNTWQQLDAHLPVGRGSLCAEPVSGNSILAIGGFEPAGAPGSFVASTRVEALRISDR